MSELSKEQQQFLFDLAIRINDKHNEFKRSGRKALCVVINPQMLEREGMGEPSEIAGLHVMRTRNHLEVLRGLKMEGEDFALCGFTSYSAT